MMPKCYFSHYVVNSALSLCLISLTINGQRSVVYFNTFIKMRVCMCAKCYDAQRYQVPSLVICMQGSLTLPISLLLTLASQFL